MSTIRLTLRTLLAYLDDTLPVEDSRIIGAKLAENREAQELVERIRKVIRKRSLPVPSSTLDGSASDPNTVAEYLSDAMKSELIAQFEQACLNQDQNLAEVAACHQILTLVLCEQVRIPPTARQRMYHLVKGRESIPNRKPSNTLPIMGTIEETDHGDTEEIDLSLLMGLEDRSKPSGWSKLGLKLGLLAALLAIFGIALWMAMPPSRSPEALQGYALLSPTRPGPATVRPTDASGPSTSKPTSVVAPPPTKAGVPSLPTAAMPSDPMPKPPELPPTTPEVPPATPMPTDPPKTTPMNPKKDLVPPPPAPLADRVDLGKVEEPTAIIIRKNPTANIWLRILPEDPTFRSTDRLVALPGYKGKLKFESDVTVELWGNLPEFLDAPILESAITPYLPAENVDVDLAVHTGRIYLSTSKKSGALAVLRFRNELWKVTLQDDKTVVIFELFQFLLPGSTDLTRSTAGLAVLEGQATLKDRYQPEVTIQKGGEAVWDSREGQARISPKPPENLPAEIRAARQNYFARLPLLPASTRPSVQALAQFAQQLTEPKQVRATFDAALSDRGDQPITEPERAASRIAILAFGALGDVQGLSDALNDPSRTALRQAAIFALRAALANQPELVEPFRQVLVEKARVGDEIADRILVLLRGFNARQVQQPETFDGLLVGMASPNIAIREMSFSLIREYYLRPEDKNIQGLLNYDAGAPPAIREAAIAAWSKRAEELKQRAAEGPKEMM